MKNDITIDKQGFTPWDDYCPVITEGQHTDVFLTSAIEAPDEYNKLYHRLNNAYSSETITLHINNGGGYIDTAFMLIDAIKNTKATVCAKLSGTVASASTIIALSCKDIVVAEHTAFMVHNYSGGAQGKGHELKAQMDFTDKGLNDAFKSIYGGFLTANEMELVIAGKDYWFNKSEVESRWNAMQSKNTGALDKLAADKKGK